MKELTNHQKCQRIITLLCKKPDWAKEIRIAQKLIKKYPDVEFWEFLTPLYPNSNTLSGYLTLEGQEYLQEQERKSKIEIVFAPSPEIKLEINKVGEDVKISRKPKSLMEFLK